MTHQTPRDDRWDHSDEFDGFEGFGEFGRTSAELAAVSPDEQRHYQAQRQRWQQEQRLRVKIMNKVQALYRQGWLSGPAYDLLQDEFSAGYLPDIYLDGGSGWYMVWSDHEQERYSLARWERHAQDLLPIGHPERETAKLIYPPDFFTPNPNAPAPQRPWHPALDSRLPQLARVTPQMRVTPPIATRKERG